MLGNDRELLHTVQAYADARMMFPCPNGAETVRLNSKDIPESNREKAMMKRAL